MTDTEIVAELRRIADEKPFGFWRQIRALADRIEADDLDQRGMDAIMNALREKP